MNRLLFSLTVLTSAFFGLNSAAIGFASESTRVGDFALLDHQGRHHQLSWYGDQKAIVVFAQGNGSPVVAKGLATVAQLQKKFSAAEIVFFGLNSRAEDNRATIAEEAKNLGANLPVLVDESQLVAESLGIKHLGETLVINPENMSVVYRGSVDGVDAALDYIVSGSAKPSQLAAKGTLGQPLVFVSQQAHANNQISYVKDIVPILQDNCVSCHHEGGIGPWAMSSHAMVRGWSVMMREVVMTRRMPPGQIDTHVGRPIEEVAGLTVAEKQLLVHWIDAGAPMDVDANDPLTTLTFNDPKFTMGEPDLVLKVPAQSIPATGVLDYRYIPVELNLDKDVWVRAMEFVPGDTKVLHHVIAYLASPADKTVRGRETGAARGDSVGGFAPGRRGEAFRDNSGRLITKGSKLLLQMHYTTSGKATVDETEVGLFLHDKPPAYVMSGGVAGQRRFFVPPHAKDYQLEGEQLIERDAYLYSLMPHMHYRGKYMSYSAKYPDGSSEILLSVPKYDFNWQFNYQLVEPLFLPAGTKIVAKGAMDNSARNPGNPDPTKPVHFGLQTKHEMFFGFTTLRYKGDTPDKLTAKKVKTQPALVSSVSDDSAK